MNKEKICVLYSGGQDSTCMLLGCIDEYGAENILTLSFDYGQRHWDKENEAAEKICKRFNISRKALKVPLGDIATNNALTNKDNAMPTDMALQKNTVVQLRNMMFLTFAASYAAENGCSKIFHGSCQEDWQNYRDCRPEFFRALELAIQAGLATPIKGSDDIQEDILTKFNQTTMSWVTEVQYHSWLNKDKLDIKIETPLISEKKEETLARILKKWPVEIFKDTWTCYNGGFGQYKNSQGEGVHCGKCPACQERLASFKACRVDDPVEYYKEKKGEKMNTTTKKWTKFISSLAEKTD